MQHIIVNHSHFVGRRWPFSFQHCRCFHLPDTGYPFPGESLTFCEPISVLKVFAERRKPESIVTTVLWSTVLLCFFPKVPVYVSEPVCCLFKNKPVGLWPWWNCTTSESKSIPPANTSFSILLSLVFYLKQHMAMDEQRTVFKKGWFAQNGIQVQNRNTQN